MPTEYRLVQTRYLGYIHFKAEPYVTFLSLAFDKIIAESNLIILDMTQNATQIK
jgi:hypothetical protein